jgi:hypothetical protein
MQFVEQQIAELRNYYTFDKNQVSRYLRKHQDLIPIVKEAAIQIRKFFSSKVVTSLELSRDDEIGWEELCIVIVAPRSVIDTPMCESRFFSDWFVKVIDQVRYRLSVKTRFL